MRLAVLLLGGVLLLSGCGDAVELPTFDQPEPMSAAAAPVEVPSPTAITIPKLNVHSTLEPLGLTPEGALEVPPVDKPGQAAWYAGAKPDVDGDEFKPGDPAGPAIISGHVDGTGPNGQHGYPGVFAKLTELVPGDEILIDREDGSQLKFVVTAVERYSKAGLPWDRIMAKTDKPSLRLITCGGEFDVKKRHYVDNDVVYAELAD